MSATTKNPRNITAEDVFNRMVVLADRDPDFRYKNQDVTDENGDEVETFQCSYLGMDTTYTELGRPCIVGQALADLGFSREELARVEEQFASDALGMLGITGNDDYMSAIDRTQLTQDDGKTWAEAIAEGHTNR